MTLDDLRLKLAIFLDRHRLPTALAFWLSFLALIMMLGLCAHRADAATVTLTAAPSSGTSPLSVTLTWSASADLNACTASGAWSGAKATSGTAVVPNVTASSSFTLTCTGPIGDTTVRWTPPATNTDGSPIPATAPGALAGFEVFHAATAAGVPSATPIVVNSPTATSHVLTGLPVGPRYLAVRAFNTEGIRSDLSAQATKTLVLPSANASASVTVNTKPNPPSAVTVEVVAGLNMAPVYPINTSGKMTTTIVGFAPLDVPCGPSLVGTYRGYEFREVPRASVAWWGTTNRPVVASCASPTG